MIRRILHNILGSVVPIVPVEFFKLFHVRIAIHRYFCCSDGSPAFNVFFQVSLDRYLVVVVFIIFSCRFHFFFLRFLPKSEIGWRV